MISRNFFSESSQSINDIINWFNIYKNAIYEYKIKIVSNINNIESQVNLPQEILGLSLKELDDYFERLYKELENVTCLSLLSAVEAELRKDYLVRAYDKKKDTLSKKFRNIYKQKNQRASLEEDILEAWRETYPQLKGIIGTYKSALNYRNWLAHGRYWIPRLDRKYDVDIVYSISDNVVRNMINI